MVHSAMDVFCFYGVSIGVGGLGRVAFRTYIFHDC